MKECILQGKNLVKTFGQGEKAAAVLQGIDLEIYEGDFTVVMGPSGAGKSTLLYILSGMDSPSSGSVFFKGRDITALSEKEMSVLRADEFGFVFQKMNLVTTLTLYENVLLAGFASTRMTEEEIRQRTEELFSRMGLSQARNRLPAAVSGGEAQRAAVARAVVGNPSLLFADEPTGALNRKNSEEVMEILSGLSREGQTILLATHDIQAALCGNRILYLEDGCVQSELILSPTGGKDEKREKREKVLSDWLSKQRW